MKSGAVSHTRREAPKHGRCRKERSQEAETEAGWVIHHGGTWESRVQEPFCMFWSQVHSTHIHPSQWMLFQTLSRAQTHLARHAQRVLIDICRVTLKEPGGCGRRTCRWLGGQSPVTLWEEPVRQGHLFHNSTRGKSCSLTQPPFLILHHRHSFTN